ncbi:MAG: pantoate--beta-alanine ligase [Flavobacteriales bacterium]
MKTLFKRQEWMDLRAQFSLENKSIGYVPTMGALHQGHASLVKKARQECDIVVVSIFVNPTQFDNQDDLKKYPNTLEQDQALLESCGCDYVFVPSAEEVYYDDLTKKKVDYGHLTSLLEGKKRPGHYDGVVMVVRRLFEIVQPDQAFFGKKDYQQLAIIRELARREMKHISIVGCELVRDLDGLALSSRNVRLSEEGRKQALSLSKVIMAMKNHTDHLDPKHIENWGKYALNANENVDLEYLEVVDGSNFEHKANWQDYEIPMVLVAAVVDGVRLIDNIEFNA